MNEELDATPVVEPVIVGDHDATESNTLAESSPASEENHEQKQDGVQKRINKLTAEKYEAKREAEALRVQNEALLAAPLAKPAPVVSASTMPTMPEDTYDQEAMAKYHTDLVAHSEAQAIATVDNRLKANKQAEREATQNASRQQVVSNYLNNAVNDGVDMDKLRVAEQVLNDSGMSVELGNHVMNDPNGAKIAEYLHDNPALMHEVLSLDPVSAGIKIANEIKPLVLKTTRNVSNAPEPISDIKGGGILERDDFERNNPGTTFI